MTDQELRYVLNTYAAEYKRTPSRGYLYAETWVFDLEFYQTKVMYFPDTHHWYFGDNAKPTDKEEIEKFIERNY